MSEYKERIDLKIEGHMEVAGGDFDYVKVSGKAKILGDVDCYDFKVNGMARVTGSVKMNRGKVNGKMDVEKCLDAAELDVNGICSIGEEANVKELRTYGNFASDKDVTSEKIKVKGYITTQGNCSAEKFDINGTFNVNGLLNADEITTIMHGKCEAKEIGGEKISIRRGRTSIFTEFIKPVLPAKMRNFFEIKLVADTIEGDEVYIEHTKANAVRGNTVKIGPGCEIQTVEYKEHFEQHSDSKIGESKKA